ncbi:Hpt domain-containing protein [Paucibacter soli]|uniref:Hpt domain-containing protein n=1 Tax=Paucibacter soli TaxID=3133433 RepID=UPI00309ED64F
MNIAVIDTLTFEALQAHAGADFVLTLLDAFAEESPQLLDALRQALRQQDGERFETAAHTLKSNCVTFGATRLAEAAAWLECQGPAVDAGCIDLLAAELAALLPALRALASR